MNKALKKYTPPVIGMDQSEERVARKKRIKEESLQRWKDNGEPEQQLLPKQAKEKPLEVLKNGQPVYAYNASGRAVCNSRMRRKPGQRCKSIFVMYNGRCKLHGGLSLRGEQNVRFTHGKYSRAPLTILSGMNRSAGDPDQTTMIDDIAYTDSLIEEQIDKQSEILTSLTLTSLRTLVRSARQVVRNEGYTQARKLLLITDILTEMADLGKAAMDKNNAKDRVLYLQNHRSRLIEKSHKKPETKEGYIPIIEAQQMVATVVHVFLGVMQNAAEKDSARRKLIVLQEHSLKGQLPAEEDNSIVPDFLKDDEDQDQEPIIPETVEEEEE